VDNIGITSCCLEGVIGLQSSWRGKDRCMGRELLMVFFGQRLIRRAAIEGGWSISVEEDSGMWPKKVGQEMGG